MKYKVGLTQLMSEEATIYVEAESSDDAERLALEKAAQIDFTGWRFLMTNGPPDVVSVEEVGDA